MTSVRLVGDVSALKALGEKLERAGRSNALADAVGRALWDEAQPLRGAAQARARAILPRRGGLAERVAETPMPITVTSSGRRRGVRIDARQGRGRQGVNDPGAIDRGRVRHPVFGHERKEPIIQLVRVGWFSVAMDEGAPRVRERIEQVLKEEISKLQ